MARTSTKGEVMETEVVTGEVVGSGILTMDADEYREYSKKKGTIMGRKPGQKTKLTIEELRVLINEGWTREEVKEKHGLDDEELTGIVYALSKSEQRAKPIKF